MQIVSPLEPRIINEYDFTFHNGISLPLSLDLSLGDTIEFSEGKTKVTLTSKPSLVDPTKILPAEEITIFQSSLMFIQHRVREIVPPTPEQSVEWMKTLQEMSKTVN